LFPRDLFFGCLRGGIGRRAAKCGSGANLDETEGCFHSLDDSFLRPFADGFLSPRTRELLRRFAENREVH
jgi:hypothetical protein